MSHFNWTSLFLMALASLSTTAIAAPSYSDSRPWPVPMNMLARTEPMADTNAAPTATETMTVIDIVKANPSLSTLSKALANTDFINVLQEDGPFTLFAPNDMAFAKLSPNVLSDLMRPENKDKLTAILNNHIFSGKLAASDIKAGSVKTVNGNNLDFKVNGSEISIKNAKVIKTDINGSNGVIHIIDTVLMP